MLVESTYRYLNWNLFSSKSYFDLSNNRIERLGPNIFRRLEHLKKLDLLGFYSDAVECWIFVRRVASSILGRVRTEDSFLRLLHLAHNVGSNDVDGKCIEKLNSSP